MRKHLLIFILPCIIYGQKHVIGSRHAGMFSNFITVLNHLNYCFKHHIKPVVYWDNSSLYYTQGYLNNPNVWEYYWQPVSDEIYEPGDYIDTSNNSPDSNGLETNVGFIQIYRDTNLRYHMHGIINLYVKLNSLLQSKIDTFYQQQIAGKFTVGIHIRGTDKKSEIEPPSIKKVIAAANKFAPCQFFIATDEQRILDYAKKKLRGPVIYTNCYRTVDNTPIHYSWHQDRAKSGQEIVIDTYLLARCNKFIHTGSNVGFAVTFLNPNIESIMIYHKNIWQQITDLF